MNYPLISEYIEAIKNAEDNFNELSNLRPVLNEDGMPIMSSGNFAVVFKMTDGKKDYAIKCFLKDQGNRKEAYEQISNYLKDIVSSYVVKTQYLNEELFVDSSLSTQTEFPIVLMDWVEGLTLEEYWYAHKEDEYIREDLVFQFSMMSIWLLNQPFAHGDIKPDNIIVRPDNSLVLIDYDGMFVPEMKGQFARETGSPDYRLPSRSEMHFDKHIDDFPILLILLSLKLLSLTPSLYDSKKNSGFIFSANDFVSLEDSNITRLASKYSNNTWVAKIWGALLYCMAVGKSPGIIPTLSTDAPQNKYSQSLIHAKKGCPNAMWRLGECLCEGIGTKKNHELAFKYFKKSAEMGNPDALCCLSCCYQNGYGTDIDLALSYNYACQAIKYNSPRALCVLANYYDEVEKDESTSYHYKITAADSLNPFALVVLANLYYDDNSIKQNHQKAFELYTKAYEISHNAKAALRLGMIYYDGKIVPQDKTKASFLYKDAEKSPRLLLVLGIMAYHGYGMDKDINKAQYYFEQAAKDGDDEAQYNLGVIFSEKEEYQKMISYLTKSAVQNNNKALLKLGLCLLQGQGIEENFENGVKLIAMSADLGNEDAKEALEGLISIMSKSNNSEASNTSEEDQLPF